MHIVRVEVVEETKEVRVEAAELNEIWSFVGKKTNPRWLWHAIDRNTGSEVENENQAIDPQDNLLFQTRADARSSHWVVYQSL